MTTGAGVQDTCSPDTNFYSETKYKSCHWWYPL